MKLFLEVVRNICIFGRNIQWWIFYVISTERTVKFLLFLDKGL